MCYSEYIIFLSLIKDLEKQEELRIAHIHLKEHQETIDELRRIVSEKTDEISNMQMALENLNTALQEKIYVGRALIRYLIYLYLNSTGDVKWFSHIGKQLGSFY